MHLPLIPLVMIRTDTRDPINALRICVYRQMDLFLIGVYQRSSVVKLAFGQAGAPRVDAGSPKPLRAKHAIFLEGYYFRFSHRWRSLALGPASCAKLMCLDGHAFASEMSNLRETLH